jgi:mono/diheme cytochrome c family protein
MKAGLETLMRKALLVMVLVIALPVAVFADGEAIYKTKCTACHGPDGSGQTPVGKSLKLKDLRSPEIQNLSDAEITKALTDGKGKMPASHLSADDIKAVIGYVRSLKK